MAPPPSFDATTVPPHSTDIAPASDHKKKKKKKSKSKEGATVEAPKTPATTPTSTATASTAVADDAAPLPSTSKRSAAADELEDLFSTIKNKKIKAKETSADGDDRTKDGAPGSSSAAAPLQAPPPEGASKDDLFGEGDALTKKRKRDPISGLPLYTEEELRLGGGGGTKDCPFDCDCCY